MEVQLKSEITCPNCGHKKVEDMPINACQFFYECENCKTVLKPNEGDCCVYFIVQNCYKIPFKTMIYIILKNTHP